jgi:hypothetical protein
MTRALISVVAAAGMVACQTSYSAHPAARQAILLGNGALLSVAVEGVEARDAGEIQGSARDGQTIHRVLRDENGKPLFAYDLAVTRGDAGSYTLVLKPAAGNGPTFSATREVTLTPNDSAVRVDLMEQPSTGRKVTDVLHLANERPIKIHSHLMALHNQFFRWITGK